MISLSDEELKVIDRAKKLMMLAGNNPNEHERASAMAKAQAMLTDYNLDLSVVEEHGDTGKRAEEKLKGGYYQWQRDLWEAFAELNLCLYWNQQTIVKRAMFVPIPGQGFGKRVVETRIREHRLVGRTINVTMARNMAEYVEEAIDRILRDRIKENDEQFRGVWANSYRRGAAERIVEKIEDRYRQMVSEQEKAKREAERKAREAGGADVSTGRTLSVSSLRQQEEDANNDFLNGEGWSARQRKEAAERMARRAQQAREAEEAWVKWCEANPEKAAQMRQEEEKRQRRNAKRRANYQPRGERFYAESKFKGDRGGYYSGREAGEAISIDPQAEKRAASGMIG